MKIRNKLAIFLLFFIGLSGSIFLYQNRVMALPKAVVFKTLTCGCCQKWVDHLKENGFQVDVINKRDLSSIKKGNNVPSHLTSCHTAKIGRYTIEGHVPAQDIIKLLKKDLDIKGLAVGGMPVGSPGMEYQNRLDPYDVISFKSDGTTSVFNSYHKKNKVK